MTRPGENEASVMDRDDLRVGDAEREQTMAALREHFAQGRLTHEELDERLDQALAARTVRDLTRVTADLPGHGPMPGAGPAPFPGLPPLPGPMPLPGQDLGSWQEAMRAHRKQMRAVRHQARLHGRGPMHHRRHRGPGPIVPIAVALMALVLFSGGFGVLKFVFFVVACVLIYKFVSGRLRR
ncbi:DUF1707 domain-containing protein [Nonomuraea sp. MCN248]|uniref:DUF1707 domain-containing protein n=1 Tax=Nonomuraea corallina TaxID=2989783 RepID=A0ABT4SMJ2_9ACTN|nr:DUF1707 domain-containing protein [Nonomuraea corallina]MDA0638329.1 DUF1707 domain-containing protein [Nonomuraea corallina]